MACDGSVLWWAASQWEMWEQYTATAWLRTGFGWPAGTSDGLRAVGTASRCVAPGVTMNRSWTGGWMFMAAVAVCFFCLFVVGVGI
jgi:hypothetical protein